MTKRAPVAISKLARRTDPLEALEQLVESLTAASAESRYIEWKRGGLFGKAVTVRTKYRVVKAALSFANSDGGFIVFGVTPDGTWEGLSRDEISEFDPSKVSELVNGIIFPEISTINYGEFRVDRKSFSLIHVPPSALAPHTTTKAIREQKSGGKPAIIVARHAVYYRHGAKSALATPFQMQRMVERRTNRLRDELLRRVREVEVPVARRSASATALTSGLGTTMTVARLTSDPAAPAVRVTRAQAGTSGLLLHEELSEGLFEEINNVLDANDLLAGKVKGFVLGREIYYRVYAERAHVDMSKGRSELLIRTAFRDIYAPFLFWLLGSEPRIVAREILRSVNAPKQPIIIAVFTAVALMGQEPVDWLADVLKERYGSYTQKPEFYWTFNKIIKRTAVSDRRLFAMRTTPAAMLKMLDLGDVRVAEMLADPERSANLLSRLCLRIFDGKGGTPARSVARRLDMAAYGHQVQAKGPAIWKELKALVENEEQKDGSDRGGEYVDIAKEEWPV